MGITIRIDETTVTGEAIDLRERRDAPGHDAVDHVAVDRDVIDRDALVAAIRGDPSPFDVDCPDPGPLHERVGVVTRGMHVQPRTALALAARSCGLTAPQDDRIEELRVARASVETPTVPTTPDTAPADDVVRLRERVAALRGEVRALESAGHDPTEARGRLRNTAGRLAELETERAARGQAQEHLRAVRDARERRLRIEDELANAERAARAHLVEELSPVYETALADLASHDTTVADDPFDAPPDAMALSILRVGEIDAPAIVAVDRFPSARAAADWLDAPVILL